MKSDSNICLACGGRASLKARECAGCGETLLLQSKDSIAVWRLGEVRPAILDGFVRMIGQALKLPVVVQPALLDPRPSRRDEWWGVSATAFLNQVERRARRGTVFSLGLTEENIVPGAAWNFLFGYAYLGLPSCVVSLHQLSSDDPKPRVLVRRAATIAIHEIGHNCGLDHHGYDEDIDCVMTGDSDLDSVENLDEGTHRFCRECQRVVERKLARHRETKTVR